jgi:hypothetical protein
MTATVMQSGSIGALAKALAAAQGEMKNPPKDSVNPHFRSRYADLATVRDAVLPVLSRHGLAVVQTPCDTADGPALCTSLLHESGEWIQSVARLHQVKLDPQGIGSALTYARRYALQSLAGVAADDDDDGNAATAPRPQAQQRPAQKAPQGNSLPPLVTPKQPEVTPGDMLTDAKAINAFAVRKGWDWVGIVNSINAKFGTDYSLTKTRWVNIDQAHREAVIGVLAKLPDVVETVEALSGLLKQYGELAGLTPLEVFRKLREAAGWPDEIEMLDDLNATQLAEACRSLRKKIEAKANLRSSTAGVAGRGEAWQG